MIWHFLAKFTVSINIQSSEERVWWQRCLQGLFSLLLIPPRLQMMDRSKRTKYYKGKGGLKKKSFKQLFTVKK